MIRKMEGAEITLERLEYVLKAYRGGSLSDQVFCAFLGPSAREDFIPYVADFFLQVEDVKWTVVAGIVNDSMVISVRNLGYTKNAGEFVRRFFSDVGSAGGHRAMAKAVIPMRAFREKYRDIDSDTFARWLHDVVEMFLHDTKDVRGLKAEAKGAEFAKSTEPVKTS
jgi:nanoRNase/pAp phosphatase (c-di-AMP/oligoRNAs hydrolase)